jgi:hypothetical protein
MADAFAPATLRPVPTPDGSRVAYSWGQTLDDVTVVIDAPPGAPAKAFAVTVTPTRLTLGLKGNPTYLDVRGEGGRKKRARPRGAPVRRYSHIRSPIRSGMAWPRSTRPGVCCPSRKSR